MDTKWIVTEIDGCVASVGADYRHFAKIAAEVAALPPETVGSVSTRRIGTDELIELDRQLGWEDLRLFGSKFQKGIWKALYELTHSPGVAPRLYSYTEIAALADNPQGVRAVAHAVAVNPVAYIIPCHLVIPKESMDKARSIRRSAEQTLFKGADLYLLDSLDVGEYAYGPSLKRELIRRNLL